VEVEPMHFFAGVVHFPIVGTARIVLHSAPPKAELAHWLPYGADAAGVVVVADAAGHSRKTVVVRIVNAVKPTSL